jgi:peptide deformylase
MARAFAHEIDHLEGILFIDRIGMVKRNLLRNKLNAIRKKAKETARSPR